MKNKSKFLVIDDNETDQIITSLLLEKKLGVSDINKVYNGSEALTRLAAHQKDIEEGLIILLDIRMPEMDGFAFLDAFDALDEIIKQKTQIFMLSSTLDPHDLERAERHKYVRKLLNKPLSAQTLGELIT